MWISKNRELKKLNNRLIEQVALLTTQLQEARKEAFVVAQADLTACKKERDDAIANYKKLLSNLRDQNEADLFLCAERVKKQILESGKPTKEIANTFDRLQAEHARLSGMTNALQRQIPQNGTGQPNMMQRDFWSLGGLLG